MTTWRNSKRRRYEATFSKVAHLLGLGHSVHVRPEENDGSDIRTLINYWYQWRRLYFGIHCKSADDEVRRVAAVVVAAEAGFDTDDDGRPVVRIRSFITPPKPRLGAANPRPEHTTAPDVAPVEELPTDPPEIVNSGHGSSIPTAPLAETDYYTAHTRPWQDWFKSITDTEGLFRCLDSIPPDMRGNSDFGTIDDLPAPDGPEGAAWKARFRQLLGVP